MFWRKFSSVARVGLRSLSRVVQRKDELRFAAILGGHLRYFSSESATNNQEVVLIYSLNTT